MITDTSVMLRAHLKPYPVMKNSGVPWLGVVPEHWEVCKLRNVLRGVAERNRPDLPLLSVVREKGVILRDMTDGDENHNFIPDDLTNYKVVSKGQFAMNKMKAWQGSYGVSPHNGIVSPAYFIFDIDRVEGAYFHSAIRSKAYIHFFTQASDGVRIGQWDLSKARMKEIPFLVPPLFEQATIVRYLDYMDRRIRKYILAKQKLIKLLNEEKQAIIHRALTRGLDPNVRLKPSGVDWLGEVPEHWITKPLKHWAEINRRVLSEATDSNYRFKYLEIGAVGTGRLVEQPMQIRFGNAPSRARRILKKGDTIISTVRTYLKAIYFVSQEDNDLIASTGFAVLTPRSDIAPEFLSLLIQSSVFIDQVTASSVGIAYPAIPETRLASFHLAAPCSEIEQQDIVRLVMDKTKYLDEAVSRMLHEISLLREYRTRLIADVVTGKLDVREAAAHLPDEVKEPEPLDDADALTDAEEEIEMVEDLEE